MILRVQITLWLTAQSQNNYNNNYSQTSNGSGQTSGDSRPANVWTNNNYKSASTNHQSNPSAMLINA